MIKHGDGSKVVICRAHHNGGLIPGKLIPSEPYCRFGTDRTEHKVRSYDVSLFRNIKLFLIVETPVAKCNFFLI